MSKYQSFYALVADGQHIVGTSVSGTGVCALLFTQFERAEHSLSIIKENIERYGQNPAFKEISVKKVLVKVLQDDEAMDKIERF